MANAGDKAAAFIKDNSAKAKTAGAKAYSLANDPAVRAKAKKLMDDGKKVYEVVTSPEAKRVYRQAAKVIKKARKK